MVIFVVIMLIFFINIYSINGRFLLCFRLGKAVRRIAEIRVLVDVEGFEIYEKKNDRNVEFR